jgi:hypothetical protein
MDNHPQAGGDSLRFSLVTRIERLAGPLDDPQLSRKVLFEPVHVLPPPF